MFSAVCVITLLCLVCMIQSGPLSCEELIRPLEKINFDDLEGRWTLLAGSLKDPATVDLLKGRDSVTIDFINSTYTQVNRVGDKCEYYSHNASLEGHILTLRVASFNFTATFFNTSCPDCAVLTWDVESPHYKSVEFYLLSRRREVEQKEMEEFRAQVECLNMPAPLVMDPTKELCPEHPETGEKTA